MSMPPWATPVMVTLCFAPAALAGTVTGIAACGASCADYVVYLEGVAGSYSGEGQVVELGQKDKVFVPHVLPLLAGSTLRVGNEDPFLHNVHAYDDVGTVFNVSIPIPGMTRDQVIDKAGVYVLLCDAHPEMSAYVVALENPFFAQPDDTGAFELVNVPAGSYTLLVFDAENDKSVKKSVTVGEGAVTVDF
jgi:plastocyanin